MISRVAVASRLVRLVARAVLGGLLLSLVVGGQILLWDGPWPSTAVPAPRDEQVHRLGHPAALPRLWLVVRGGRPYILEPDPYRLTEVTWPALVVQAETGPVLVTPTPGCLRQRVLDLESAARRVA